VVDDINQHGSKEKLKTSRRDSFPVIRDQPYKLRGTLFQELKNG